MFSLPMDLAYLCLSAQQAEEILVSLCRLSKPTLTLDSVVLSPHLSPLPVPHFSTAGHSRQVRASLAQ